MPVLRIYGLAHNVNPRDLWGGLKETDWEYLTELKQKIKTAVSNKLDLSPEQITLFFVPTYGPAEADVIVFVDGLFVKPERDDKLRAELADVICAAICNKIARSGGQVEVFVTPFAESSGFSNRFLNVFSSFLRR